MFWMNFKLISPFVYGPMLLGFSQYSLLFTSVKMSFKHHQINIGAHSFCYSCDRGIDEYQLTLLFIVVPVSAQNGTSRNCWKLLDNDDPIF